MPRPWQWQDLQGGKPGSAVISDMKLESCVLSCTEGAETGVSVVTVVSVGNPCPFPLGLGISQTFLANFPPICVPGKSPWDVLDPFLSFAPVVLSKL